MIEDKAKEYAEGKALSAMTSAIEQAYIDGYNAGFQDGLNHQKPPIEVIDGVEYVDLGLPSGTKWSKTYFYDKGVLKIYSREEAKQFNLPTQEQLDELLKYTTRNVPYDGLCERIGKNGEKIYFKRRDDIHSGADFRIWIKSEDGLKVVEVSFNQENGLFNEVISFPQGHHPIMLVR